MPRRSLRLQQAGYYTEQGTPFFNYKETLIRIFRRRKYLHTNYPMNPTEGPSNPIDSIFNDIPLEFTRDGSINRSYQASASLVEVKDAETNATVTWTPKDRTAVNRSTHTLIGEGKETEEKETQTTNIVQKTKMVWTKTIKTTGKSAVKTSGSSIWKFISGVLLVFVLFQSYGHLTTYYSVHFELRGIHEVLRSLQQRTNMYFPLADTLPNLALESKGARTLQHLSSDTYRPQGNKNFLWDTIFNWWYSSKTQRGVIQEHSRLIPGECWPFSGGRGHLVVSLSHPVSISHVTLSHITKSQSPHGHIASAPREFSIYGMRGTDEEGTLLGRMVYDQDGTPHQTFALSIPDNGVFRYVRLQIESNWGSNDHTCLYNFRVHGKTQPTASEFQGEGH